MFAHLTQVMSAVERAGGRAYKGGPPKPESHVESVTSIFPSHPTITKKVVVDSRSYTVDTGAPHRQLITRGEGETEPKQTQRA
jgi:hypothetical protein